MKFRAIVEYEYPTEHKPPVKAEIVLHGDRVTTENIKRIDEEPYEDAVSRERMLSMALYKLYNAKQIIGSAGSLTPEEIIKDWDDMFDFIENLPSVRPTDKWIPVSERLPEEEGKYLVYKSVLSFEPQSKIDVYKFYKTPHFENYWKECVVALMPLPEPYKESEE